MESLNREKTLHYLRATDQFRTYKLFERMILTRLSPLTEEMIIDQQAGFRPGKSTTGQLFNLKQHIEDGFERAVVTGTVFVDLSATYDIIRHKLLLNKIYRNILIRLASGTCSTTNATLLN